MLEKLFNHKNNDAGKKKKKPYKKIQAKIHPKITN